MQITVSYRNQSFVVTLCHTNLLANIFPTACAHFIFASHSAHPHIICSSRGYLLYDPWSLVFDVTIAEKLQLAVDSGQAAVFGNEVFCNDAYSLEGKL